MERNKPSLERSNITVANSIFCRIQNNFPGSLISFEDPMRFGGFTQRQGSVDDRANLSRTRGLKGFIDIGKMSSGGADDA